MFSVFTMCSPRRTYVQKDHHGYDLALHCVAGQPSSWWQVSRDRHQWRLASGSWVALCRSGNRSWQNLCPFGTTWRLGVVQRLFFFQIVMERRYKVSCVFQMPSSCNWAVLVLQSAKGFSCMDNWIWSGRVLGGSNATTTKLLSYNSYFLFFVFKTNPSGKTELVPNTWTT